MYYRQIPVVFCGGGVHTATQSSRNLTISESIV